MTATATFVANADHELLDSLGVTIDRTLDPLIPRGEPLALVDFPRTANVGDSLIWLGTLAWLARSGRGAPRYLCSDLTYDSRRLAKRVGRGTILLGGGGNFGDLYPGHQAFRERVIADFPTHRIVQLPQSIHFQDAAALARTREVVKAHPRLTLLVRDEASLDLARAEFPVPSSLCPDLALALGPLRRPSAPTRSIVWLSRNDKEARDEGSLAGFPGLERVDWVTDDAHPLIAVHLTVDRWLRHRPALRPWAAPGLEATFERAARSRVARGVATLAAGRVVVTNRLHGHVLALLLGIPHFVVDNSYGKVRGLYEAWTRGSKLARFCETQAEALDRALRACEMPDVLSAREADPLRSPS